jgi:hypothetical protein
LKNIPVLDDLPVLVETENINPSIVVIARPLLMTVEYHPVSLRYRPFEMYFLARIPRIHSLEIVNERFLTIADFRIVLDILVADIFLYGFSWSALVEH